MTSLTANADAVIPNERKKPACIFAYWLSDFMFKQLSLLDALSCFSYHSCSKHRLTRMTCLRLALFPMHSMRCLIRTTCLRIALFPMHSKRNRKCRTCRLRSRSSKSHPSNNRFANNRMDIRSRSIQSLCQSWPRQIRMPIRLQASIQPNLSKYFSW